MARHRNVVEVPERRYLPRRAAKDAGEARAKAAAPQFTDDSDDDNPKNHFARKQKAQPANEDEQFELDPLSGLPREIFYLIAEHLDPQSLMILPYVCKSLQSVLMSKTAAGLWQVCAKAAPGELPPRPADLSWPAFFKYFFGKDEKICSLCKIQDRSVQTYYKLRVSLCLKCDRENVILESELEDYLGDAADEGLFDYVHSDTQHSRGHDYRHCWYREAGNHDKPPRRFFLPELRQWQKAIVQDDHRLEERFTLIGSIQNEDARAVKKYKQSAEDQLKREESARQADEHRRMKEFVEKMQEGILLEGGNMVDEKVIENYYAEQEKSIDIPRGDWHRVRKMLAKKQILQEQDALLSNQKLALEHLKTRQQSRADSVKTHVAEWILNYDIRNPFSIDRILSIGRLPILIADDEGERAQVDAAVLNEVLEEFEVLIDEAMLRARAALLMPPRGTFIGSILDDDAVAAYVQHPTAFWRCSEKGCYTLLDWSDTLKHSHQSPYTYKSFDTHFTQFEAPIKARTYVAQLVNYLEFDPLPTFNELSQLRFACAHADTHMGLHQMLRVLCKAHPSPYDNQLPHVALYPDSALKLDEQDLIDARAALAVWRCDFCRRRDAHLMTRAELIQHVRDVHKRYYRWWYQRRFTLMGCLCVDTGALRNATAKSQKQRVLRCLDFLQDDMQIDHS